MTTTSVEPQPATTPAPRHSKRSKVLSVLLASLVIVLTGLVVGGIRMNQYLTHPNAFWSDGTNFRTGLPANQTVDYGAGIVPRHRSTTVTITSIRPVITHNTSAATINLVLCKPVPSLQSGVGGGTDDRQIMQSCQALLPVDGATLRVVQGQDLVFAQITAHRPGVLTVDGYQLQYTQGLRHQTQVVGNSFTIKTP